MSRAIPSPLGLWWPFIGSTLPLTFKYMFMDSPRVSCSLNTDAFTISYFNVITLRYVSFRFKIFSIGFSKRKLGRRLPSIYTLTEYFKIYVNITLVDVITPFTF
jgi:hypothetical protein